MKIRDLLRVLIIFIIIMIISTNLYNVFAAEVSFDPMHSAYTDTNQFDNHNKPLNIGKTNSNNIITKFLQVVLTIARNIALGWAIIMSMVIAYKYMTSSPNKKGQLKIDMPTYIMGALLLFGAAGLMGLIQSFTKDIFG